MKLKHLGIILIVLGTAVTLLSVFFYGPRPPADAIAYLLENPLATIPYVPLALLYAMAHGALVLFVAIAAIVAGVFMVTKSAPMPQEAKPVSTGKSFRIIDAVYFLVALPLILTVLYEYVICTLVAAIGIQGGGPGSECSIGWGIITVLLFVPPWAILTLALAPVRLKALYALRGTRSPVFWLYVVSALAPIPLLASLFFGS